MAVIRPDDLPAAASVPAGAAIIVDDGSTVEKATPVQIVDSAIPLASQAEAEAGVNNAKRVTPLRVKQAIEALGLSAANAPVLKSSGAYNGYMQNPNALWIGDGTGTPSDNAMIISAKDYSDVDPLVNSVHHFCTVGTNSNTVVAGGQSANSYDTALIFDGDGDWGHDAHYQTGDVFRGNVHFDDVLGLAGSITVEENAQIDRFIYVDFSEPVPTGTANVGRNTVVRYLNSHFASDMTAISSSTINYALEVRKFLLDPATAYSASVYTEGQATHKVVTASDGETSPYNPDGTLNTALERFNCFVGAGQKGYLKFSNGSNSFLIGQVADSIDLDVKTASGNGWRLKNAGHWEPLADGTFNVGSAAAKANQVHCVDVRVNGTKVVGAQGAAVADATDAASVITQLNALLARMRAHGLIAT